MEGSLSLRFYVLLSRCVTRPLYSFNRTFPLGVSGLLWEYDYLRRISTQTWPASVKADIS